MKVLLVTTPMSPESIDVKTITIAEPLALEYLGAGIREQHDVKLVDLRLDTEPGLKEVLESYQPDIIGCGATTPEVYPALEICAEAKKISPGILTVVGGHHASVQPSDFINENVDVIVRGEGVHPFKKICDCHEKKTGFSGIGNIYYRENGKMVFTRKEPFPDLDSLPFPARTLTAHLRQHYRSRLLYKSMPSALIRSSVGCSFRCTFCPVSGMLGHKLHKRSIDNVIEELATLVEQLIIWVDDEFLLDGKRAVLLAKEIEKAGIKKDHYFLGRADTIVNHPESIEEWAKIGLKVAFIGLESHREADLKAFKKGTSESKNREAIRILHENNVTIRGGFIIQPDFEREDFRKLAAYVKELGVEIPSFSIYTPIPGTQLWEETKDRFILTNYNYFDMLHTVLPTKLPLKQFYKEFADLSFKRGLPFKTRKKFFKAMKLKELFKFLRVGIKMYKEVVNGYRLYR